MTQHQGPLLITEGGWLAAMGVGELGRLFNVLDQIRPGRGKTLVRLRFCSALHQGLHDSSSRNLLAPTIENLLLKLSDQGIGLVAELDRELLHDAVG